MGKRPFWVYLLLVLLIACLSACNGEEGTNGNDDPVKIATAFEGSLESGTWVLCWNQIDKDGKQVAEGVYVAEISANDFTASRDFTISSEADHIASLICNSLHGGGILPTGYSVATTALEYAVGDTVNFIVELPVYSEVTVEIFR